MYVERNVTLDVASVSTEAAAGRPAATFQGGRTSKWAEPKGEGLLTTVMTLALLALASLLLHATVVEAILR